MLRFGFAHMYQDLFRLDDESIFSISMEEKNSRTADINQLVFNALMYLFFFVK